MNKKLSVTLFNPASIEIGKIIIVCLYLVIWFAVIISFPFLAGSSPDNKIYNRLVMVLVTRTCLVQDAVQDFIMG